MEAIWWIGGYFAIGIVFSNIVCYIDDDTKQSGLFAVFWPFFLLVLVVGFTVMNLVVGFSYIGGGWRK